MMRKPNSHQPLEILGKYIPPEETRDLVHKYFVRGSVPEIHNCVDIPQNSSEDHVK
jgi:hypothetical protein